MQYDTDLHLAIQTAERTLCILKHSCQKLYVAFFVHTLYVQQNMHEMAISCTYTMENGRKRQIRKCMYKKNATTHRKTCTYSVCARREYAIRPLLHLGAGLNLQAAEGEIINPVQDNDLAAELVGITDVQAPGCQRGGIQTILQLRIRTYLRE